MSRRIINQPLIQVIKRKGNFYKSRLTAVGIHSSKPGARNPSSISLKRPEEYGMNWRDRGAIELPSGYNLAESWAGLRKSWRAFEIANRNKDRALMSKYAYQIRRLQADMGLIETVFDEDLLSDEAIKEIQDTMQMLNRSYDSMRKKQIDGFNKEIQQEERVPDYEALMHDAKEELPQAPLPRKEIFATYKESANACEVPIEPACEIMHDTTTPVKKRKGCRYVSAEAMHDTKKKRRLKSCYIRMK